METEAGRREQVDTGAWRRQGGGSSPKKEHIGSQMDADDLTTQLNNTVGGLVENIYSIKNVGVLEFNQLRGVNALGEGVGMGGLCKMKDTFLKALWKHIS